MSTSVRLSIIAASLTLAFSASAAQPAPPTAQTLTPTWTLTGLANPESSHPSAAGDFLYVSNVAGEGDGRDGNGTGSMGHSLHGPNRTDLRQGYNTISVSEGRWIAYSFDAPPNALPLEAVTGSGDSGGPILVAVGKDWHVAGISAWKRGQVEGTVPRPGRYGEISYGVRLGNYADWIEETIADSVVAGEAR